MFYIHRIDTLLHNLQKYLYLLEFKVFKAFENAKSNQRNSSRMLFNNILLWKLRKKFLHAKNYLHTFSPSEQLRKSPGGEAEVTWCNDKCWAAESVSCQLYRGEAGGGAEANVAMEHGG